MAIDITEQFVQDYDLFHEIYNPKGDATGMATTKKQATAVVEVEEVPTVVAEAEAIVNNEDIPAVAAAAVEPEPITVVRRFDPTSKLVKVKGGQLYLQVRDRLIWLREEHPEAQIATYLQQYYPENGMWVVKAEVTIWVNADGSYQQATGSGMGQETERDFPAGALEKAETKAIGRALATLGYGTQFALEMDEGSLADSPVQHQSSTNGKRSPAGVETLREDVIAMLEADTDAKSRMKAPGEMTEDELSKAVAWLRLRANRG